MSHLHCWHFMIPKESSWRKHKQRTEFYTGYKCILSHQYLKQTITNPPVRMRSNFPKQSIRRHFRDKCTLLNTYHFKTQDCGKECDGNVNETVLMGCVFTDFHITGAQRDKHTKKKPNCKFCTHFFSQLAHRTVSLKRVVSKCYDVTATQQHTSSTTAHHSVAIDQSCAASTPPQPQTLVIQQGYHPYLY